MATAPFVADADSPAISAQPLVDAALILLWVFLSSATGLLLFGYSRDYIEYLLYYQSIPVTFSLLDTRFEPGFHAVAWIFRNKLDVSLSVLAFALALFSLAVKFFLFRKYLHYPLFAAIIYTVVFFPIHEYTQYRVGVSLAFGFWAVHMLIERRLRWAAVLLILSFLFHYSCILLFAGASVGILVRRRNIVIIGGVIALTIIAVGSMRGGIEGILNTLNPLSGAYLQNRAMIEGVSVLSINNLLLIAALLCYAAAGYLRSERYLVVMWVMTVACLLPIALLPDAPVIAQRSKEVLFPAVVFLAFRHRLTAVDLPGLAFVVMTAALLGYLWVDGGVIFS